MADKCADVGIAALDLNTGESLSIKGNTPFPMASTVKVAIAALYLSQVDHGQTTLDDTIRGQSVRSLMNKMLIHSDNRAADILFKDVGGPRAVHRWLTLQRHHRASMSTARSPSFSPTSGICGTAGIRARRRRWSTSFAASTRPT